MFLSKQIEISNRINDVQAAIEHSKGMLYTEDCEFSDIEELLKAAEEKLRNKPVCVTFEDLAAFIANIAEEAKKQLLVLDSIVPCLEKLHVELRFRHAWESVGGSKSGLAICISTTGVHATWY